MNLNELFKIEEINKEELTILQQVDEEYLIKLSEGLNNFVYTDFILLHKLGLQYRRDKDYKNALMYIQLACDKGYVEAWNSLAYMHYEGLGLEIDKKKALEIYISAADKDNTSAQYNVAVVSSKEDELYDLNRAIEYCKKAKQKGHYYATKRLVELINKTLKCPVTLLVGRHMSDTPGYDIELDTILKIDSFLKSIDGETDIKLIPRNFKQLARWTIEYDANVLIVEDGVNDIQLASFKNIGTLVYLGTKSFPSIRAFKSMKVNKAIFINSGFLGGSMFLLEGCFHIMKNFEEFNDKENFIMKLKKKSEKLII